MIRVVRHDEVARFAERVRPLLEANEAENNLMLAIVGEPPAQPAIWIEVEDGGRTVAAALCTPPFPLALTRASDEALQAIAERLAADGVTPSAVVGPSEASASFAVRWSALTGVAAVVGRQQRIFSCDRVIAPGPVEGRMRAAGERDLARLTAWAEAFAEEAGTPSVGTRGIIETRLRAGRMRLWETDAPVAMVGAVGITPNGARVGFVYTPPEQRRRGYGSAVTAALTAEQLASGRRFVFLYTDLANPTSNKIYQALGYRPVCDADEWRFQPQ